MKNAVKQFLRLCVPPLLYGLKTRLFSDAVSWRGDYETWADASSYSKGYDDAAVIDRVAAAMRQVVAGKAVFERDSVLFNELQYAWPVLAGLLKAAVANSGGLRVLDFGGALGSSYYQNRKFLMDIKEIKWSVVEQAGFVECARKEFETEELRFFHTIEAVAATCEFDVVLLSSVLPYLENPYDILAELLGLNAKMIIIDRTPVLSGENDRLTVQRVPDVIYRASYPAWFLSEKKLLHRMAEKYSLLTSFDTLGGKVQLGGPFASAMTKGYIFKLKQVD